MNDTSSLSHTTWNCKYHIVFAPKYRRKIFYQENKKEIGEILRRLCEWKQVEIIEVEVCPDHKQYLLSYTHFFWAALSVSAVFPLPSVSFLDYVG